MIQHMDQIAKELISQDTHGLITRATNAAADSERLCVNIDRIPPESFSTKHHSHSQQEEFSLVLSGNGTVRLNDKSYLVTKSDFFVKPSEQNIAHSIYNFGGTDLILLDIGTVGWEGIRYYPDEDMYPLKLNGQQRIIGGPDFNNEWTVEPNADKARDTL